MTKIVSALPAFNFLPGRRLRGRTLSGSAAANLHADVAATAWGVAADAFVRAANGLLTAATMDVRAAAVGS